MARIREHRIYPEDFGDIAGDAATTFHGSMTGELDRADCLTGAHAVWSMWRGYLNEPSGLKLRAWLDDRGIPLTVLHSSGHASVADLQRLAAAVETRKVIPVHTRHSERYEGLFDNVELHAGGEWWWV